MLKKNPCLKKLNKNDEIFDLESKIDELVYNIYGLSSDEMRMMQESH